MGIRPQFAGLLAEEDSHQFPLSLSQAQIWQSVSRPGAKPGLLMAALGMRGPLDAAAWKRALAAVSQRHEVLRTVIRSVSPAAGSAPAQVVLANAASAISIVEGTPAGDQASILDRQASELSSESWSPDTAPLFRARLVRLSAENHLCIFAAHPLIFDAFSFSLVLDEASAFYAGIVSGRAPALPELRIQYPDFAVWQNEGRSDPAFHAQRDYWTSRLAGLEPLPLANPALYHRNGHSSHPEFTLSQDKLAVLETIASSEAATLFDVLLAALQTAISRFAQRTDVAVSSVVSGRHKSSLQHLVGPLGNTLVFRTDLSGAADFRSAVRLSRQTVREALQYQDIPAGEIPQLFAPGGEFLPEVGLLLEDHTTPLPVLDDRNGGLQFFWEKAPQVPAPASVSVRAELSADRLRLAFEYRTEAQTLLAQELCRAMSAVLGHATDEATAQGALAQSMEQAAAPGSGLPPAPVTVPVPATARQAVPPQKSTPAPESSPASRVLETLAGIWRKVLNVPEVSPQDNFFDLGGHSLLAIRIVTRVENALRIEVPLSAILENPTLQDFANCITVLITEDETPAALSMPETRSAMPPVSAPVELQRRGAHRSVFPMSYAQNQMWVIDQLEADIRAYNMGYAWRLRGPLDLDTLRSALDALIERHEPLRTLYQMVDGEPAQIVLPAAPAALEIVDLEALPERMRAEAFQQAAVEHLESAIDLAAGPVARFHLFRFSPREHSLVLTIHHIAFDEASAAILIRDLAEMYTVRRQGSNPELPELPFQYADFSVAQRRKMEQPELQSQVNYWRQRLADAPASFEIPTDHPRGGQRSYQGAITSETFSPALLHRLEALGRQQGVTLFMVLLAAFDVLLYRYTGQADVVLGSPITGRHRNGAEDVLGVFVNTLILRTDLSGNPTFRELLKRVRKTATDAYDHSDVPFALLVKELGIDIDITRNPLFQIMLIEQDRWVRDLELEAGPTIAIDEISSTRSTKFDLTAYVREQQDGLRFTLEYSSNLFEPATMERLIGHYRTILESIAEDVDAHVAYLPILTQEEQQEILVEWNHTAADVPLDRFCLHQLIEAQAERTPRQAAVVFDRQQLTYAQLEEHTNRLASLLRERGVGPGVLVGVCVHRSLEMIVGLLGILKAGGAYVPLDPAYPQDRLSFMLEDSQLKLLLTQQALASNLAGAGVETICLDSDWETIARQPADRIDSGVRPQDVAYVIYTSGSTGRPKGVEVTHRNLVNFVHAMVAEPGMTAQDTLLSVTTISFDIAGLELYVPLTVGAKVVIANSDTVMDGNLLIQRLREANATVMQATPVTWRLMIESGWKGKNDLKILCGGEALTPDLAEALVPRCAALWNMYGPTETTIWSTAQRIQPAMETILIGHPIANTQVYVLSPEMRPVPVGVVGELYIGGDGLARGYLKREELTAERFVPNPFAPGERMYRTGDFVRFRSSGAIEYLGRADQQVKIRGHRIELGEIESLLRKHPSVRQAVVVVREDVPQSRQIVAYVVGEHYSAPVPRDLAQFLGSRLPVYMVPNRFVVLDSLPLTPNGKINRKALPAPTRVAVEEAVTVKTPRSATERSLAEIWSEVLGVQPIGTTDNFFELGGHSIEAVKLFARIASEFGVKLSLNTLLNSPTIEQLAVAIDTPSSNSAPHRLVPIQPHGSRPPLFWIPGGRAISVLAFRDISMMFGADQPAYGVESRLPVAGEAFLTVPERATRYIELIRARQAHGPYQLAGFCMGGMVAFEMAQQLRAQGEQVSLLAMLQANVPGYPQGRYKRWRTRNQRRLYQVKTFAEFVGMRLAPKFLGITREARQNVLDRVTKLVMGWVGTSSEIPDETQNENLRVMYPYRPHMYAGSAQVFLAEDCYESAGISPELDGRRAWTGLVTGGCQVHVVPGDHHTMLSPPYAKKLADLLLGYMRDGATNAEQRSSTVS